MTTKKEYKNTEIKQKSNQEVAKFGSPFHITRIEGGLDTPSPPLDPPLVVCVVHVSTVRALELN